MIGLVTERKKNIKEGVATLPHCFRGYYSLGSVSGLVVPQYTVPEPTSKVEQCLRKEQ